jgi:hypothetical protein
MSQVVAEQQIPLLHAPSPVHRSVQRFTVSLHVISASHAEPPSHLMLHVVAVHSIPAPHALALRHWMLQLSPPHRIIAWQLVGPVHSMAHELAAVQSIPPWHEVAPPHIGWHAMPAGHLMSDRHE